MATASSSNLVGQLKSGASVLMQGNIGIPVMLLVLLGMMTLPLPPFLRSSACRLGCASLARAETMSTTVGIGRVRQKSLTMVVFLLDLITTTAGAPKKWLLNQSWS